MSSAKAERYGISVAKKKCITDEQLGCMIERIESSKDKVGQWYPTMEDAKKIAEDPLGNYEFVIWILYSNPDLELNDEQEEVRDYLECLLMETTCSIPEKEQQNQSGKDHGAPPGKGSQKPAKK